MGNMAAFKSALIVGAAISLCWLALWRCWRIFRPRSSILDHPAVFFLLSFSAILALRWVTIDYQAELNVDESQMVAQGMRFLSHPVPWRDVDSTTSGPLNSMALSVPFWCGAPPTWETARLVLFIANCVVVFLMYRCLRLLLTRSETQFVLMPLILFYGFVNSSDYTHYSSETLSCVLLAAGIYLLAKEWRGKNISKPRMFLLGLLLGAVPFAKLQAAPLAGYIGVVALALIVVRKRRKANSTGLLAAEPGALILGAVLVPALILGVVATTGAFGDFWTSYIVATRKDAVTAHIHSPRDFQPMPSWMRRLKYMEYVLFSKDNLGLYFFTGLGVLLVLWGIYRAKKAPFSTEVRAALVVMAGYGCMVFVCLFTAGKPFAHYGILMLLPVAALTGLVYYAGKSALGSDGRVTLKPGTFTIPWLIVFAAVVIIPQLEFGLLRVRERLRSHDVDRELWVPSVYKLAQPAALPGDTLSIWGWMPQCYVQLGLPPATRDAVGHYAVASAFQDYYRPRYLADLKRGQPAIFIDAVGDRAFPDYLTWTTEQKHESFSELSQFIDDNYSLFASVELQSKSELGPIRIYVRKERLAELHLSAIDPGTPPINDYPPGDRAQLSAKAQVK